jgi:hypothetical protein
VAVDQLEKTIVGEPGDPVTVNRIGNLFNDVE